jgi:DNA-binding beta-propeller fold protein YncE
MLAAALAAAACAAGQGSAAGAGPGAGPVGRSGPLLYVTNQNGASVSIIDADARAVVGRVDLQALGFGPNAKPHDIAVEPDGSFWYVSLIGENRVLKFDRENRLVGQVEMEVPGLVIVHPTEDLLFVGRSMTAVNPPPSVAMIRRSDMTLIEEIDVLFPRPHALTVRPQGDFVYSASLAENRMAAIDPASGDVVLIDVPAARPANADSAAAADSAAHAAMGHDPAHTPHTLVEFAVSPDGRTLVTGGEISGDLLVFDLAEPAAPRLVTTVRLGGSPWHPAFSPDGRTVWVPLHRADQVAVVDAATWTVADRITGAGFAQPHAAVPTPDGRTVYVSNNNTAGPAGSVVAIDAATRTVAAVLEVGPNATGMDLAHPRP